MKHIQAWLLFIIFFIFRAICVLLGLFIVPLAYISRNRKDDSFRSLFWLWDNREDGIFGPRWFNYGERNFESCYHWSAIRNPANNMRFIDLFNVTHSEKFIFIIKGDQETPNPALSRATGQPVWHYTLVKQGWFWYPSFWYLKAKNDTHHFRVRLGWKCTPEWIQKPRADIYNNSGLTFQFMPNREG